MNVTFSAEDLAFQDEVRAFFRDEYPAEIRETMDNVMSVVVADYRGVDVPTVTAMRGK